MSIDSPGHAELPAWARPEAFPVKPDSGPYGLCDITGKTFAFSSWEDLTQGLRTHSVPVDWVWISERQHGLAPEEVPELGSTLLERRRRQAGADLRKGRGKALLGGVLMAVYFLFRFGRETVVWDWFIDLTVPGFLLVFLIRPWLLAKWDVVRSEKMDRVAPATSAEAVRYDSWLQRQPARVSLFLVVLTGLVFLVQLTVGHEIAAAGLVKSQYRAGETWRLFTGAFLHGNALHLYLNLGALWYLGRRAEVLARWVHLPLVILLSLLGGAWASVELMPQGTSVGLSGGISGILGFLLVFERWHRALLPESVRRELWTSLGLMVLIGFLGFRFLDNAAHAGGLLTGFAYALIVFPPSSSARRPRILPQDRILGGAALLGLTVIALAAVVVMLRSN